MSIGLCCNTCDEACRVRLNVIMSDAQAFDASGVTFTAVIKQGGTTVATVGPLSPSLSAYQEIIDLLASTAYTVELTVEQDGGTTCTFNRSFTTPAVCNPFSFNLFIPRVWVAFYYCSTINSQCRSLESWGMPIDVTGPGSFTASGTTTTYPDPPPIFLGDFPKLKYAFTPCAEGDYTITPTLVVPNTAIDPMVHNVNWPGAATDGTEAAYFADLTGFYSAANLINPAPGYVWPSSCNSPVPATLHLSSTKYGAATLEATDGGGYCGDGWTGTGGGLIPDCDGGTTAVSIAWGFSSSGGEWRLNGIVSYVCLCRVFDAYGNCQWTIVGGGTGTVTLSGGQAIVGTCNDCDAMEWTISLTPASTASLPQCPDTAGFCSFPVNAGNVNDTVTITP